MKEKTLNILFGIFLTLAFIMLFIALYSIYRLCQFNNCYQSDFQLSYCEYYKTY